MLHCTHNPLANLTFSKFTNLQVWHLSWLKLQSQLKRSSPITWCYQHHASPWIWCSLSHNLFLCLTVVLKLCPKHSIVVSHKGGGGVEVGENGHLSSHPTSCPSHMKNLIVITCRELAVSASYSCSSFNFAVGVLAAW